MTPAAEPGRSRLRAGFLGPAGTFSEEALLASVVPERVEPVALASIYETVVALRDGRLELAIVPIENSLEGSINVTLDLLADETLAVRIVGEALLRVRHALIAKEQLPLEDVRTVVSHPQVPGQCTRFLRSELARARIVPASSTAEAVRSVLAEGDPATAALGTELAARIYGGTVLRADVQDRADNETRFVWLARAESVDIELPRRPELELGGWRCSIVFWGPGTDHPGWLVRCLDEFAKRAINLTKIESRPRRQELGSYMFFLDLAGSEDDGPVAEALAGLRERCDQVRVLGSYRGAASSGGRASAWSGA
jgi:prephenate dehydratase